MIADGQRHPDIHIRENVDDGTENADAEGTTAQPERKTQYCKYLLITCTLVFKNCFHFNVSCKTVVFRLSLIVM